MLQMGVADKLSLVSVSRGHFDDFDLPVRPTPAEFDLFVPWACYQLGTDSPVVVTRNVQRLYVSAAGGGKEHAKSKILKAKSVVQTDTVSEMGSSTEFGSKIVDDDEGKTIQIETTYDENLNLVQIRFLKTTTTTIPRLVIKVIALAIPYHRELTSIIINKGLTAQTLYEMSKFFRISHITEVCLDSTYLAEANYHLLLDNDSIIHLSLSKCHINDVVVKTLAQKLTTGCPAAKSLSALNLSTNKISDVGAKYIADMLRSNRRICYLNLADNRITDVGAISILDTLGEFALTKTESLEKSMRVIAHIKKKNELIAKTLNALRSGDYDRKFDHNKKKLPAKPIPARKKTEKDIVPIKSAISEANLAERAENIAEEIMGAFNDPFSPDHTRREKKTVICYGNNTLSYLSLAFNNLSYASVKKLCDVIRSQTFLYRKPKGLINVRIEGNYLPETCHELLTIDNLLLSGLGIGKVDPLKKRTASRSFKSSTFE